MSYLPLDSPNEEIKAPKKFRNLRFQLLAASLIAALLSWTVAANVNVSTGGRIEFGQGATQVLTCDSHVVISPDSQIDTQTGTSYLRNLKISDISSQLRNSTVTIDIVDTNSQSILQAPMKFTLSSDAKTISSTTYSTSSSIDRSTLGGGPKQEVGKSSITFSNILSKAGGKVNTTNAKVFVLQTSGYTDCTPPADPTCAEGGTCGLGSTGPSGGTVFYVAATPFTDPTTGNTYKYIEVAPKFWTGGVLDPRARLCTDTDQISSALSQEIGYAKTNTDAYIAEGDCTGATGSTSNPPGLLKVVSEIRKYGADWQLPTLKEAVALCKFARFGTGTPPSDPLSCEGGSLDTNNWSNGTYITSTKPSGAGYASFVRFSLGTINYDQGGIQTTVGYFRPIRYFN